MRRILVNPHRSETAQEEFSQNIDSTFQYTVDFSVSASDRGESVASVAWSANGSSLLSITNKSESNDVATASISGSYSGVVTVEVTATYDSGDTESQFIEITVENPRWASSR